MLQPNEIYLNGNNSTVQIASAHETSKTFSYNGNEVLFDIKDDVMVNATQLAKIYGKRPNDYLSLPATNQLINAITRKYGISENQLVISKAGSSHNGSPDKPGGLSIQLCKSEKKEFYIRYSS